jgi:uncharacterized protein GlcG (DUF336 family)
MEPVGNRFHQLVAGDREANQSVGGNQVSSSMFAPIGGQFHRKRLQPESMLCRDEVRSQNTLERDARETRVSKGGDIPLSLAEANSIVNAAIAKARELKVNISVAVCDSTGNLIALNRMDGAYGTVNRFSIGKAVVSAGTGLPSGEITGIVEHPPVATVVAEGMPAVRFRGGLPILRGNKIEGACGVDGALSNAGDEECARAGILSLRR